MFSNGVSAYVDLMKNLIPRMKDGTVHTTIDTGCGVSFPECQDCFEVGLTQLSRLSLSTYMLIISHN
ncbi:putative S-adenosyl-L-methionine-dependent methyltransferase [Helianthus annuus]|nr:putative S-adenosyl-L-methionine-dependent methyltransferase [Helianthus annuus]